MFSKILIANRGEIAVRILRACREMGIKTVAVYSQADKESMHVKLADQAVCIGPASPAESYLNAQAILSAAVLSGAEAIHPGFGFLSESAKFAQMIEENGIKFIGPSAKSISLMGDKAKAREIMQSADVPVVPGSDGPIKDAKEAKNIADKIGYPLLIKAAAGGGGRGIRRVDDTSQVEDAFNICRTEAKSFFGDDTVYMEKLITSARHVEVQIIADEHGNTYHLFERDCSVQRRNQKVIEESLCPVLSEELRAKMINSAINAAKAVNYINAGTIEFLLAGDEYYFMEMNTRIQVEHTVTEMITGVDLVREQINIAAGNPISFTQEDVKANGHVIECRINAENPDKDFRPSAGTINKLQIPGGPGIRFDTFIYPDYKVLPYYDSMLGKLIVKGRDRSDAIAKMEAALFELTIDGIDINKGFLQYILSLEVFNSGKYDTNILSKLGY